MKKPSVLVLLGSTGIGKTALSLELARRLGASIVSADSRQVFREIPIGTAAPTSEQQSLVPHYLVGHKSIHELYSAGDYELEALAKIEILHKASPWVIVSGGSMMYIDALCSGIDPIPSVDAEVRRAIYQRYEKEGLTKILEELAEVDPLYYGKVDHQNYKRVLHGYEVYLSSGKPLTSYYTSEKRERPFRIIKVGVMRPREELYERIDMRTHQMLAEGLLEEARAVHPFAYLNALNTVGFKELFAHLDGHISLKEATRQIQRNTRHYARKQMTWWQRDKEIAWFSPHEVDAIEAYALHKSLKH